MAILCIFLYLLCIWRWFKIKSKEVKTNKQTPNRRLQWLTAESSWTSLLPHLALLVTTFISLHSPLAGSTPVTSSSFSSMSNSQMGFHVKVFTFDALLSSKYTFLSSQGSVFLFIQLSVQMGHIRLFYFLHTTMWNFLVYPFVTYLLSVNVSSLRARTLSFSPPYTQQPGYCLVRNRCLLSIAV